MEKKIIFTIQSMSYIILYKGPLVQLDRTERYGRFGWGFESLAVLQKTKISMMLESRQHQNLNVRRSQVRFMEQNESYTKDTCV